MTLKECYRLLELPKAADLDEIKRAYRRLAFELHPDLNPGKADAAQRFQEVNEAYVLLTRTLQEESKRDPRVKHRKESEAGREEPRGGARSHARKQGQTQKEQSRPEEQPRENAQAQSEPKARPAQGTGAQKSATPGSRHGFSGSAGPSASRPKPGDTAGTFAQAGPRSDQYGPSNSGASGDFGSASFDPNRVSGNLFNRKDNGAEAFSRASAGQSFSNGSSVPSGSAYGRQEEVLGEILNDPFARRVFEDIYSELKKERPQAGAAAPPRVVKPKPVKKKKLSLEWGGRRMSLDLTHGFSGAVKSWLRGQLDQEQVLEMPAAGIVPGARIRLQVHVGIVGHSQSVEVTLPPDYLPGTPIRLKGLGRKLGGWRGDLYLRVVPQGTSAA